jgi:uncharacterized protein (TIGR03000 family)
MAALTGAADTPSWHHGGCGCHGYYSGCYGCNGCYGCYGCWGTGYGCYGGCYGAGYAYGCCGCWGSAYQMVPAKQPAEMAPPPKEGPAKNGAASAANTGKLIVELPENTKLYVDDQLIPAPAGRRSFNTPPLQRGVSYYYMVRAELVMEGKTHSETKQVIVRAGESAELSFPKLVAQAKEGKATGVASAAR